MYADHRLNALNSEAETVLAELGLAGLTLSVEDDEKNMGRLLGSPGPIPRLLYLYGRPPLFTTGSFPAD